MAKMSLYQEIANFDRGILKMGTFFLAPIPFTQKIDNTNQNL